MDEAFLRRVAAKIRRLAGKACTLTSDIDDEYHYAIDKGLLVFEEWISGHFVITERGKNFLADYY
ncbi:hypothetical protein ACFOYU_09950 [Microvirga sp. GCM10011540]|uniref:hypothetical protein n=1 Tax=Microvirga sp. GCM10011540 TaxID=3317338 RepID=UPI003610B95E